jgi:hypothetical protein
LSAIALRFSLCAVGTDLFRIAAARRHPDVILHRMRALRLHCERETMTGDAVLALPQRTGIPQGRSAKPDSGA